MIDQIKQMKYFKTITLLLFLLSSISFLDAQTWIKRYDAGIGERIFPQSDGTFVIDDGGLLITIDASGNVLGEEDYSSALSYAVIKTSDGGVAYIRKENGALKLLKFDSNGIEEWRQEFATLDGANYVGGFIEELPNGQFAVAYRGEIPGIDVGSVVDYSGAYGLIDVDGSLLLSSNTEEGVFGARYMNDGNIIFFGNTEKHIEVEYFESYKLPFLHKVAPNGNIIWAKVYDNVFLEFANITDAEVNGSGNLVVGGFEAKTGGTGFDAFLMELDSDGNILWYNIDNQSLYQTIYAFEITPDGGYVLAGIQGDNFGMYDNNEEFLIQKRGTQGLLEWEKNYGWSKDDYLFDIVTTNDGGYLAVGTSEVETNENLVAAIKMDANGNAAIGTITLKGNVWYDTNANCNLYQEDYAENWIVYVLGDAIQSRTTDSNGYYEFNLPVGNYTLSFTSNEDYIYNVCENDIPITLTSSELEVVQNLGIQNADCEAPVPTIEVVSANALYLSWTAQLGISSYVVKYRAVGSTWTSFATTEISTFISDLLPSTNYEIQIRGICTIGSSDWSPTYVVATSDEICEPPATITTVIGSPFSVSVSWDEVPNATEYQFALAISGTDEYALSTIFTTTSIPLSGLIMNESYDIKVRVRCSGAWTDWSEPTTFIFVYCGNPNVVESVISGNVIRLSWSVLTSNIDYTIRYRQVGASTWIYQNTNGDNFTAFNGLTPNTTYEYQLQTTCTVNTSPWSNSNFVATSDEICDRPINIAASQQSESEINVTWDFVSNATKYKVAYALAGTENYTTTTLENVNSYTIDGLQLYTDYDIKVKAKCSAGWTNWSEPIPFILIPDATCPYPSHTIAAISGNVIKFTFDPVDGAEKYKIRYREQGSTSWQEEKTTYTLHFVNELTLNTVYEYSLKTVCADETSVWSPTLTIETLGSTCDFPAVVNVEYWTFDRVRLSWYVGPGAEKYRIKLVGGGINETITQTEQSIIFFDLQTGVNYKALVKSKCEGGWTNYGSPIFFDGPSFAENIQSRTKEDKVDISVYPNPSSNFITIQTSKELIEKAEIFVYNKTGQLVHQQKMINSTAQLSIAHLPNGMYQVLIKTKEKIYHERFAKQERE